MSYSSRRRLFRWAVRRWIASRATGCEQDADVEGVDHPLDEVLVDAAVLVEQAQGGFEAVDERPEFLVREPLVVDAAKPVDHADVAGLREERRVVDEAPEGEQRVDAPGLADSRAGCGRPSARADLQVDAGVLAGVVAIAVPGGRAGESGASPGRGAVAHSAKPYSPANISTPARKE